MKRRQFIKTGASLWALSAFSFPINAMSATAFNKQSAGLSYDPLQNIEGDFSSLDFNGDNINRPHDILWNIDGYVARKGGYPAVSAHYKNIVVGGGMSGLLSQYFLTKKEKSLLLEQETILGGNSRGEIYNGKSYSIGAAYFANPDDGSDIDEFLKEINIKHLLRVEEEEAVSVFYKNKIATDFWNASTAPEARAQFEKLNSILNHIYNNTYPDIPVTPDTQLSRAELNALDSINFYDWLKQKLGPDVHPHIVEYYQLYCWSSFAGTINELSAAQVLSFVASGAGGSCALPGGNARITSATAQSLKNNPNSEIRSGAFVLKVQALSDNKVLVVYENADGQLVSLTCDKCVVAAPKYVARRIVFDLPDDQAKAFDRLNHRGYLVANILLNKNIPSPGYDLFNLKNSIPVDPAPMKPTDRLSTDVVFADWANHDRADHSILTVYRPLPYDGARQFLFNPNSHDKHKRLVLEDVGQLLGCLNLTAANIAGVRMTRWGHSIPLASVGLVADAVPEVITRPIANKIYFVNQDNWANPAFETCFDQAKIWTNAILS